MKRTFYTLILSSLALIHLSSCKKNEVIPDASQVQNGNTISTTPPLNTGGVIDTVNVTGYLRLHLAKDNFNTDGMLIVFKPTASTAYVKGEDAPYFSGFGQVTLWSSSSDNVALSINVVPLTPKGLTIGLNIHAQTDGTYYLKMDSIHSVPKSYQIWLKDNYKKDSLDMRLYSSYAFDLYNADTTSFGQNRFKLVIHN
jgi:hypothetical protein